MADANERSTAILAATPQDDIRGPRRVHPATPIQVLVYGVWHSGELEAWQARDGRWRGNVRWTVGVGMRRLGWVDQDRLRPS